MVGQDAQGVAVFRRHAGHTQGRIIVQQFQTRSAQKVARYVNGNIRQGWLLCQRGLDEQAGFDRTAAAELHKGERRIGTGLFCLRDDGIGAAFQDGAFGARRIVFRQITDLLKQLRASLVVKEAARQLFARLAQPVRNGGAQGLSRLRRRNSRKFKARVHNSDSISGAARPTLSSGISFPARRTLFQADCFKHVASTVSTGGKFQTFR